jgi:hypothetical protein
MSSMDKITLILSVNKSLLHQESLYMIIRKEMLQQFKQQKNKKYHLYKFELINALV